MPGIETGDRPDDVRIRLARPDEAATVKAIITEAFLDLYRGRNHPDPRPTMVTYENQIARGEAWMIETPAAAARDGRIVGVLILEPLSKNLRIDIIAIRPDFQHRGIGRRAFAFVEAQAREIGVGEIWLYTNSIIDRNIGFYRRLGFSETGRWEHPKRPGEIYINFSKRIDPRPTAGAEGRAPGSAADTALDPTGRQAN